MNIGFRLCLLCLGLSLPAAAQTLDIYFIDVEGGGATLLITPERQSILIDSGWPRDDGRDVQRILKALKEQAGLAQLDYLITTHFHRDHYGGALRLAHEIPILNFLDRGPMVGLREDPQFPFLYADYLRACKGERRSLSLGEDLTLKQGKTPLIVKCVAAGGETMVGMGPQNAECRKLRKAGDDTSDNAASVALLLHYGKFDFFHGADLTWNIETKLACPINVLGQVEVYQVDHHGFKVSNNPALLRSISPTVAVMANGAEKGCDPEVVSLLKSLPSLKGLYQLHKDLKERDQDNTDPDLIANLGPESGCAGNWIKVSVDSAGSTYAVTNSRNQLTRSYSVQ